MKIQVKNVGFNSLLTISDGAEVRVTDLTAYGINNKTINWLNNGFEFFNEHVVSLLRPEDQTEIYKRMIQCLERIRQDGDFSGLQSDLSYMCAHMYDVVDIDKISYMAKTSQYIKLPANVRDSFQETIQAGSLDQTYLTKDYRDLVAFSCASKFMIPIWLEQVRRIEGTVGRNYTDVHCFRVLARSKIMTMPAIHKLSTYIECNATANDTAENRLRNSASGNGTYTIREAAMARVVVSLIPHINPMSPSMEAGIALNGPSGDGDERSSSVITKLYFSVRQSTTATPRRATGMVSAKFDRGWHTNGGPDEASSTLEEYRAAGGLTEENKEMVNAYAENAHRLLEQLFHGKIQVTQAHRDLLDIFLANIYHKENNQPLLLQKCQTSLAIWAFGTTSWRQYPVISVRYRDYLRMRAIYNMVAVAQTFMWVSGYKRLAGLISASVLPSHFISGGTGRDRLRDTTLLGEIDEKFSAALYSKSRRRASTEPVAQENRVLQSIDYLIAPPSDEKKIGFSSVTWKLRLPPDMLEEITGNRHISSYPCPREIATDLASYVNYLY